MSSPSENEQSVWLGSSQSKETKGVYTWKHAQPWPGEAWRNTALRSHFTQSDLQKAMEKEVWPHKGTLQSNRNTN